jgi:Glycosyltransferase family 87/WD40-like Beta Propeller Repeat
MRLIANATYSCSFFASSKMMPAICDNFRNYLGTVERASGKKAGTSHPTLGRNVHYGMTLMAVALFFWIAIRPAWSHVETDFPNYYTAAAELRRGTHLRDLYDWTSFQRAMNRAGFETQLGAYTPQTPLTMLPFVPLTYFSPLLAKRIWLCLNLVLLLATLSLLSRMTRFRMSRLFLLAFLGLNSWRANFAYGQYYIVILFLLTCALYCQDERAASAGIVAGIVFVLKLYGGPFLFFFLAQRRWRASLSMIAAAMAGLAVAFGIFGWDDLHYYATQILPRSLQSGSINPYDPGNQTITTFLQQFLVPDPELNPSPAVHAPWLLFFLRSAIPLGVLAFVTMGIVMRKTRDRKRDFAWFAIAVILLSTSVGSYTYVLLFLPVVLILDAASPRGRIFIALSFAFLAAPNLKMFAWLFPKVCVLIILFIVVGSHYFKAITPAMATLVAAAVLSISAMIAHRQWQGYRQEPNQQFALVKRERGTLSSLSPAITRFGVFYQAMGKDRYVLHWLRGGDIEELVFDGQALTPVAENPDGPIRFELVSHGRSKCVEFDPRTRETKAMASEAVASTRTREGQRTWSPDGRYVAWVSDATGPKQIWFQQSGEVTAHQVTKGNCNSWTPAWDLDSKSVVFASDCGRAVGLPTLYRAKIAN